MHLQEYIRVTEINVIFIFAVYMLSPVLAPYLKSMGFDNVQLSLIFSIAPFVLIFSSSIIGRISDSVGRRTVLMAGICGEIIAILLYAFGTGWVMIVLARILDLIATITVSMAVLAKIEDVLKDGIRGKYTGISLSLNYVGRLVGPVIGGLLADHLFVRAPFFTAIIILLCLFFLLPKKEAGKKRISKREFDWFGGIRKFLSHRELRGMAILGMVMHATYPAFLIFLPLLVVESMGLSYSYVGYAYFALALTHILQFVFGAWSDRKAYRIVLAGTMISGIFMALVSQVTVSYYLLLLILFLKGIGNSMWNISAWTLMSKIGERERIEGEVIGSYISIAKIGSFVSFLVSGIVVQFYGIETLFLANGLLIVLGTLLAYPLLRKQS